MRGIAHESATDLEGGGKPPQRPSAYRGDPPGRPYGSADTGSIKRIGRPPPHPNPLPAGEGVP